MPTERPSFLDRVNSAQQNINGVCGNESQRNITEAQRDLTDLGVVSAFQEVIDKGIITIKGNSDKPIHIETGASFSFPGYFLVYTDCKHWIEGSGDYSGYFNITKEAIGVIKTQVGYQVGCYNRSVEDNTCWWENKGESCSHYDMRAKMISQRNEVLNELATVIAIFKHNQRIEKTGSVDFLKYP